jgi:hypothetical protein
MWPATVGFLLLVLVVFIFGVKSARSAARSHTVRPEATTEPKDDKDSRKVSQDNPAMAMAGPTGANGSEVESRNSF